MNNKLTLTIMQRLALYDLMEALSVVNTEAAFRTCMDGPMQQVFPHGGIVCGMVEKSIKASAWKFDALLTHRYPIEFLKTLRQIHGGLDSPMIKRWRATRTPVLYDRERYAARWWNMERWWTGEWVENARKYNLENAGSHGLIDLHGTGASYFCFVNIPDALGDRQSYLLNLLTPHLHMALARIVVVHENPTIEQATMPQDTLFKHPPAPSTSMFNEHSQRYKFLTVRERHIARWVGLGKTNAEIAKVTNTSEHTVSHHLTHIFRKVGVSNRTSLAYWLVQYASGHDTET